MKRFMSFKKFIALTVIFWAWPLLISGPAMAGEKEELTWKAQALQAQLMLIQNDYGAKQKDLGETIKKLQDMPNRRDAEIEKAYKKGGRITGFKGYGKAKKV